MGPHEDLEKISNCLTAMPNEISEHSQLAAFGSPLLALRVAQG